ncbi:MAG: tetratricopeptide repeat protein [Planctomycetaceae bacterium]|nr:tetratricopeptide repeat protein [Planctomycetaceae bacterium]
MSQSRSHNNFGGSRTAGESVKPGDVYDRSAEGYARPVILSAVALLLAGGTLALLSRSGADNVWQPFVWGDVALVHLVLAWPLAELLIHRSRRIGNGWRLLLAAGVALLIAGGLATVTPLSFVTGLLLRTSVAVSIVVLARAVVTGVARIAVVRESPWPAGSVMTCLVAITVALVLPGAYTFQRTEKGLARLKELLPQQRMATADRLSREILAIRPDARIQELSLQEVSRQIGEFLRSVHTELARPVPPSSSPADRLYRASLLAVSGASRAAIDEAIRLTSVPEVEADACLMLGTLYEEQEDWNESGRWYFRARDLLEDRSDQQPQLVRAWQGIAFARRKAGDYSAAEESYRQALSLSPTADIHFLLAQFYEDTQRPDEAWAHAQTAMRLDPQQFTEPGQVLRDKLMMHHVGCLSIYRSGTIPEGVHAIGAAGLCESDRPRSPSTRSSAVRRAHSGRFVIPACRDSWLP